MSRRRQILGFVVAIAALAMLAPATAMAGGGSAGDQQYVDPLGGSDSGSHSGSSSHSGSTSTQPSAPSSTSSSSSTAPAAASPSSSSTTVASSNSTTTTTTSASSSTQSADPSTSSSTLPRTGLDIYLAVAIGVGLLGCGFVLRRTTR